MTRAGLPTATREVREVAGHDRAGADDDVAADGGSGQHDRAVAEPRSGADRHRPGRRELLADREVDIRVPVVGVGHVDVVAGEHVVADLDRLVRDDPAPPPDQATVTDRHDRRVVEHMIG